jgi:hypothetical protein
MVTRWRVAALLPAPSPARASTPWVSARPSSGPVVAPKRISRTPTTRRRAPGLQAPHGGGSTRTEAVAPRLGRICTASSISGEKIGSRVWFLTRFCICFLHFFP